MNSRSPGGSPRPLPCLALVGLVSLLGCSDPSASPDSTRPTSTVATSTSGSEVPSSRPGTGDADVIFTGGVVLTMDPARTVAKAIAIRGDRIIAVGRADEVLQHSGPNTSVIDLQGRTLMPGFVDSHAHLGGSVEGDAERFRQAQDFAIRSGITTITEMGLTPEVMEQLKGYDEAGLMRLRWNTYLNYNSNCGEAVDSPWDTYAQGEDVSPHIRNQGVKMFSDGGSCHVPAVSFEYPGGYGHGDLFMSQEEITTAIQEVQASGHQIAIHALGDRAVETVQNAFATVLGGAENPLRHRIEHNAVIRDDMLARYNELGIMPTIFGSYPTCFRVNQGGDAFKYVVPDELGTWEWPWRGLLDANPGLRPAWHSDFPVFADLRPMMHLYGFVTRDQLAEDGSICEAPDWLLNGAITVDEALPIMTINAAYAIFREAEVGSLEVGKLADMIVLSQNPREVEVSTIKDIEVLVTMIGGAVEFCAAGSEPLCPVAPAPGEGTPPIGYLDFPGPDAVISGTTGVEGWALADDGIARVEVHVDGQYVGDAVYGFARPDVDDAFPGRAGAPNFGYVFELDTTQFANGPHTIEVVAVSTSGSTAPLIPESLAVTIQN